jgi:hypothetical protein
MVCFTSLGVACCAVVGALALPSNLTERSGTPSSTG